MKAIKLEHVGRNADRRRFKMH